MQHFEKTVKNNKKVGLKKMLPEVDVFAARNLQKNLRCIQQ